MNDGLSLYPQAGAVSLPALHLKFFRAWVCVSQDGLRLRNEQSDLVNQQFVRLDLDRRKATSNDHIILGLKAGNAAANGCYDFRLRLPRHQVVLDLRIIQAVQDGDFDHPSELCECVCHRPQVWGRAPLFKPVRFKVGLRRLAYPYRRLDPTLQLIPRAKHLIPEFADRALFVVEHRNRRT